MATNNDGMTPEERDLQRQRAEALQNTLDDAARAAKATADRKALFGRAKKVADGVQQAAETVHEAVNTTLEAGDKAIDTVAPIAKGAANIAKKNAPWIWRALKAAGRGIRRYLGWIYFKKDKDNKEDKKKFAPISGTFKLAGTLMCAAAVAVVGPIEAYNFGTMRTYDNVLITAHSQGRQFLHPIQAGTITTPTDEIYTVHGLMPDPIKGRDGKIHYAYDTKNPISFDVDENVWIGVFSPRYLYSQIPGENAICTLKVNGGFVWIPRGLRAGALKYLDVKPKLVQVIKCENQTDILLHPGAGQGPEAANDSYHVPSAYAVRTNVGPVRFDRAPAASAVRLG